MVNAIIARKRGTYVELLDDTPRPSPSTHANA
jgi:hypothetical protein